MFLKFAFFYHDNLLLWTVLPNGETLNLEKKVYYFYLLCAQGIYYIILYYMVQDIGRKDVSLSKFKGKILLIVNDASQWYELCIFQGRYVPQYVPWSLIFFKFPNF